ncbi:hypothetical protein EV586_10715 [Tumebacillus sp. BK434]|uniref:hypothetical protein n=1 Tax=Tumebacillus sp. BK434 TaxID=2512169 RepID=UPI001044D449|nr:hypothetical protein [Tumebacillus sp. BK434]TCP52772.1 hypothetical protein EV586_10715 [Tumebacillus sp. BK434]
MDIGKIIRDNLIDYALQKRDFAFLQGVLAEDFQKDAAEHEENRFQFEVVAIEEIDRLAAAGCALVFDGLELAGEDDAYYLGFIDDEHTGLGLLVPAKEYTEYSRTAKRRVINRRKLHELCAFSKQCGLHKW